MTVVFILVFSVLTQGLYTGAAPYPVFVLLGQTLWTLFASGTTQGGSGILLRSGLVRKLYFPREYITLGNILTVLLTSVVSLSVLGVLLAVYGIVPGWPALLFPVILVILLLLVVGISLLLATVFIHVEDLKYLWQLVARIGLFASPVIYEPKVIPSQYAFWYGLNPMVGILNASRDVIIYGEWPSLWTLVYPALLALVILGIGLFFFKRNEHLFAERL